MGDEADRALIQLRSDEGGHAMSEPGLYMTPEEVSTDIEKFKKHYTKVWRKYSNIIQEEVDRRNDISQKIAARKGVTPRLLDANLVAAVIAKESAGNRMAESQPSPAMLARYGTAKGLMQMIDGTASDMGVTDVYNARQNIRGGTRYLVGLIDKYKGDRQKALAAYNCGPGCVDKVVAGRQARLPKETRKYVPIVEGIMPGPITETDPRDIEFEKIDPETDIIVG